VPADVTTCHYGSSSREMSITATRAVTYPADVGLGVASLRHALRAGMSTEEFVVTARRLGFASVELCDRTVSARNVGRISRLLRTSGVESPSFAIRNDFTAPSSETDELRHVIEGLDLARALGSHLVRVWTGEASTSEPAKRLVRKSMVATGAAARERGLTLAIETHGGLSNDVDFMSELCAAVGPQAGVCLDFGNVAPPAARLDVIRRFSPLTTHVHVKSYAFLPNGSEASFDLHEAIRQVAATGYQGLWICEYEGTDEPEAGIAATARALLDARAKASPAPSRQNGPAPLPAPW
jgi:sugar phosphate isomerase/epimerase